MTKTEKQEQLQASRKRLESLVSPGQRIFARYESRSRSGMYRTVRLYVIQGEDLINITGAVATVLAWRYDRRHEAIGYKGCGFSATDEAVMDLSLALFNNAYALQCCTF